MGRLFICGDLHGNMNKLYHTVQTIKMESDDMLVVLGDFGFIWNGTWKKEMRKIERIVKGTIFVVLGNHENYTLIKQLPHEYKEEVEGEVWIAARNVWIAYGGGGNYTINGNRCLVINGADSTDKVYRTEGKSWWADECLTYEQELGIVDDMYDSYDFIFSHCTAKTVANIMWPVYKYDTFVSPMEHFMDFIYSNTNFTSAYFGHYHDDESYDKYNCLWQKYIEL